MPRTRTPPPTHAPTSSPRTGAGARRSPTPHASKVRHAIGDAGQRYEADASAGETDGGDWMAERIEPADKEPGR